MVTKKAVLGELLTPPSCRFGLGTTEWNQFIENVELDSSHTVNGFLGGGQVRYNWHSGRWLWGLEGQGSWANLTGGGNCGYLALVNCKTTVDGFASFAVRLGATVDRALIYAKGGAAWSHVKYSDQVSVAPSLGVGNLTDHRWGWMAGAGLEYALYGNWSAKVEYNYMDFGKRTYVVNSNFVGRLDDSDDITQRIHLIKFGVNYRLGPGRI